MQHGGSDISSLKLSWNEWEHVTVIIHMEIVQFQFPPKRDLTDGKLADSFRKCKRQLEVFIEASGTANKPEQGQTVIILHCA